MTRAERRRTTREGQSALGEVRNMVGEEHGRFDRCQDWLNAAEVAGYYYEYVVKPDDEGAVYGIYEDHERTQLRFAIACKGGEAVVAFLPSPTA